MTEIASVKHLSVGFQHAQQSLTAVDDLSFSLQPGETLALLGESGCGKSLTSLALMRLLPRHGVYGRRSEIYLAEHALLNIPERLMRDLRGRRIAMIFQEPMTALNPVLSIGDQLAEALQAHQTLSHQEVHARMLALLADVEMPDPFHYLQQYPHQLSGGQKQRIVIAMALASRPDLLIADEPTTALDVTIQAQILALLKKLQAQYQMSMLLITHDLGVVQATADRVGVMYAGQLVELAPVEEFFKEPKHPYAQQLFISLPSFTKRGQRLQTLSGNVPTLDVLPSGCRFHPRCAHAFEPCATLKPELQTFKPKDKPQDGGSETIQTRTVRCHLYPELKSPPPIAIERYKWPAVAVSDEPILTVKDLVVDFHTRRRGFHRHTLKAVDGLSFTLHKGQTLALVGESGCGKTTTSRALLRLQPIHSGQIDFEGENIAHFRGRRLRQFRQKVQIIFQDPYSSMNPRMTIDNILAEGLQAQGMTSAKIRARQLELLDAVQLPSLSLERYPHQFSGGQRQRICIARALATQPSLLICDEPTSALDMSVQAQIINLLKSLQHDFGLSYLFITHNMEVVAYMADEVLVMQHGKEVEKGSCEHILMHPEQAYTKQLLASVLTVNTLKHSPLPQAEEG